MNSHIIGLLTIHVSLLSFIHICMHCSLSVISCVPCRFGSHTQITGCWFCFFQIVLYMVWVLSPPIIGPQLSINPCPLTPYELMISIASLNVIIQNLDEQTLPCGKPTSTITESVCPPMVVFSNLFACSCNATQLDLYQPRALAGLPLWYQMLLLCLHLVLNSLCSNASQCS